MTAPKYERGEGFKDIHELINWLAGGNYTYLFGKRPMHPSVVRAQQLRILEEHVGPNRRFAARKAVLREVEP